MDDEQLMTQPEVATLYRASVNTLRYWRQSGYGPPAYVLGRNLRYKRSEVLAWLESRRSSRSGEH